MTTMKGSAQVQAQPAQGGGPAPFGGVCGGQGSMFIPMVLIFVIFYFMLIRPQQKKQKEHQEWLKHLQKGDEVVTSGGLVGKIFALQESLVTLEIQDKVRVRVLRSHISGKGPGSSQPGPDAERPA